MTPLRVRAPHPCACRFAFVLLSLGCVPGVALGQDPAQRVGPAIDEILAGITPAMPGCAVAVSRDGELLALQAYGSADLEGDVPLTPETVFDVGSLTKQFVAAAVLLLVQDERIGLDDDIRDHIPELPDYGHVITVDQLMTHTSGLRDWLGLQRLSSEEGADALSLVLRQRGLNFVPGEEWSYSNSGYVLLKELVARVTEGSFADYARERIFEPLGMQASAYVDDPQAHENVAVAYKNEGGEWKEDMLLGIQRGGGGALLSTVGDLILWNDALAKARLGAFVTQKLEDPARLNNGRKLGYARGLFSEHSRGRRVIWHTGSAAGYKALLTRLPDHGVSIAVLSNAGDSADRMRVAIEVFDLLAPVDAPATPADTGPPVVVGDLAHKAGLFLGPGGELPLRLLAQGSRLRVAGGPELVPLGEGRFRAAEPSLTFRSEDEFELHFSSDDAFELVSMEGERTGYHRTQPVTLDSAELEAYVGRYESDELQALMEVWVEGFHLRLTLNGSQELRFGSVGRDAFQIGQFLVRFQRDAEARVTGFDFSNPALRNVPFVR